MMLTYPNDRHNDFVQLTDDNGTPFVPDFIRSYDTGCEAGNAMKFAGAFLLLAKRYNDSEGGAYERNSGIGTKKGLGQGIQGMDPAPGVMPVGEVFGVGEW